MATGRNKEEMKDVTLLGNKNNKYEFDYDPSVLETFENKHQGRDYFVKFNCPSLHHYVRLQSNPTLLLSIFHIFQT